jgi:tight adherence protein B
MRVLAAAVCGAGVGLGAFLLVLGGRRRPTSVVFGPGTGLIGRPFVRLVQIARGPGPVRVAAAIMAAAAVGLVTRWPVAALTAGVGVSLLPRTLRGAERDRAMALARLQALATWTESLAATLSSAAGLEQAIVVTARSGPPELAGPLADLADALQRAVRLPETLRAFAADVNDPTADTVVAALLLAATHGGAHLNEPLSMLAADTRQEVTARRQVEIGRARVATDTRLVIAVALTVISALILFNREFLTPYNTLTGQLVLAAVSIMGVGAISWLNRLARVSEPARVISPQAVSPTPHTVPDGSGAAR